ncbi:hypothetical protein E3T24_14495 [Cryobacterium sp. TmT2-59]|uniref:hypothetical protein n=1 Tax=unclassified Cryobacterium TaxID=2649013 RepID=UPI001068E576|nr:MULTISPECIES: hypothetical protein [unclassified Cryobacterium]TFC81961.1 hypothetical protein E3T24_14495 [Cryobacterium sp. TmT2-59]TFD18358.1 hypothetical protein E3T32_12310 [Cryobacterium sp. TMT2-23]TFD18434.1 hypothetical protein E3T42_06135 [Cryobacterium sp. TMT4-10]
MADGQFPGAQSGEKRTGADAAFSGIDALGALGVGEDSDQAFEPEVRGSVRLEGCGEVGAEDAANAVAVAKSFGFIAAVVAVQECGDARSVTAGIGAVRVFARQ